MRRDVHILIMEDEEEWREILRETLEEGGFHADFAETIQEAKDLLRERFYHMLILDIRMEDRDPSNVDGMNLLASLREDGSIDAFKILIVTGHVVHMRDAFHSFKVEDFIYKRGFDGEAFISEIRELVDSGLRYNINLEILWDGDRDLARQAGGLAGAELEDLLCRLFHKAERIAVRSMASDRASSQLMLVDASYPSGGVKRFVVKVGDPQSIDREYRKFKEHVETSSEGGYYTAAVTIRRTMRLGGIVYSLVGTTNEKVQDFGCYFRHVHSSSIRQILEALFCDVCGNWYENRSVRRAVDLRTAYRDPSDLSLYEVERSSLDGLETVRYDNEYLYIESIGGDVAFVRPSYALLDKNLMRETHICTTHGRLQPQNILVDNLDHVWLIGFENTGQTHFLRDVAELDSSLRLRLLASEEASIEERYKLEKTLHSARSFDQLAELSGKLTAEKPMLSKVFEAALHLRKLAGRLGCDEISELYVALLFCDFGRLRDKDLSPVLREHALVSTSFSAEAILGSEDN